MIKNKFFIAEEIAPKTWRITNYFDGNKTMMTYSYLVEGDERAMLIDTMFGYGDIKAFCCEVTDKPIILVNTHYHGDHAGGNFDFDECYIHALDIPFLKPMMDAVKDPAAYAAKKYEQMKNVASDDLKDTILPTDFSMPHYMNIWPVFDGDIFELGNRPIEVIYVGGHTAGEIVLLDRKERICYTGDACNSNTLLNLPGSISVEEYLEHLYHFKSYQDAFDHCHGGHEDFDASIVDEGIELVKRVLAGTDDHEDSENFGRKCLYGAFHKKEGKGRADGKNFNIAYLAATVKKAEKKPRML